MSTKYYGIPVVWNWEKSENRQVAKATVVGSECFVGANANTIDASWGSVHGQFKPVHFFKGSGQNEDSTGVTTWGLDSYVDGVEEYHEFRRTLYWEARNDISYSMSDTPFVPKDGQYTIICKDYNRFTGPNKVGEVSDYWDMYTPVGLDVRSITVAQPSDFSVNSKNIYDDMSISFILTKHNLLDFEIIQDGAIIYQNTNVPGSSDNRVITIPSGTIKTTKQLTLRIRSHFTFVSDKYHSDWVEYDITGLKELEATKPSNVRASSKEIFNNIDIYCDSVVEHTYEFKVFVNEALQITKNYGTSQVRIPHGTISDTSDTIRVEVKSKRVRNGYTAYSDKTVYNLTSLTTLEAETPRDVRFVGVDPVIEMGIKFAWTIEDISHTTFTGEIWQNGSKIYTQSNISSMEHIIPPNTMSSTEQIQFRVFATKTINGYTDISSYGTTTISNLQSYKPIIEGFELDSKNMDYPITIIPTVDRVDYYTLLINDETTVNGLVIPNGVLHPGYNKIELTATVVTGLDRPVFSSFTREYHNIVQDLPIIYSLEPNAINVNVERANVVSFAINEFCDTWELFINNIKHQTGTNERAVEIPSGTFINEDNELSLLVTYAPKYSGGTRRVTSKQSIFTGYSTPKAPIYSGQEVYNTSTPKFVWSSFNEDPSNTQTEFQIILKDIMGDTLEQRVISSNVCEYQLVTPLQNNTQYMLLVSIKNKYGLWSDFSKKTITTSFNDLPTPQINIVKGYKEVNVNVAVEFSDNFGDVKVYKKELYGDWVCIAEKLSAVDTVVDYTVVSNLPTQYKAAIFDKDGAFKESMTHTVTISYQGFLFSDVTNSRRVFTTYCCDVSIKNNRNIITKTFSNKQKPDIYYGSENYKTGTFNADVKSSELMELEDIISNGEVFCYRDRRGRKIYCSIVVDSIDYVKYSDIYNVTMSFIEVSFTEEGMYSANFVKETSYLDGKYRLDGSLMLDGYIPQDLRGVVHNA